MKKKNKGGKSLRIFFIFVKIDWSQTYSSQKEILEYLKAICRKHKIYENTRFETQVKQASWANEKWVLKVKSHESEETLEFDLL